MKTIFFSTLFSTLMWLGVSGAEAAGDDPPPSTKTCPPGQIYSDAKGKCVKKGASVVPDAKVLQQAWMLTKQGEMDAARELFQFVADRDATNPVALNGLGYTNRKMGAFDNAIGYYRRAIQLDPNYLLARSYLAKGYVSIGLIDHAREQLDEIAQRCTNDCRLETELAMVIDRAKQGMRTIY